MLRKIVMPILAIGLAFTSISCGRNNTAALPESEIFSENESSNESESIDTLSENEISSPETEIPSESEIIPESQVATESAASSSEALPDISEITGVKKEIPTIHTDSPVLAFLNDGPLTAELQYVQDGLIIHIFYWE